MENLSKTLDPQSGQFRGNFQDLMKKLTNFESMKLKSPLPQEAQDKNANIYKILANSKRL